jgi:hypothetical protein
MRAAGGQARSRVYQPSRLFKIALTAGLTLRQFFYPTNRTELGVFRCVHVRIETIPNAGRAAVRRHRGHGG